MLNFNTFIEKLDNCGYNKVVLVFCGWAHWPGNCRIYNELAYVEIDKLRMGSVTCLIRISGLILVRQIRSST